MKHLVLIGVLAILLFQNALGQSRAAAWNGRSEFPFYMKQPTMCPLIFSTCPLSQNSVFTFLPSSNPLPIVYANTIPQGAVFCRMENRIYERCNIWLKIRAGDADTYHRMIDLCK
jgi:hypothetical protein